MFQDHPIGLASDYGVKRRKPLGWDEDAALGALWHMAETFGVRCEASPALFGWRPVEPGHKAPRFRVYLAVTPDGRAFRGEWRGA